MNSPTPYVDPGDSSATIMRGVAAALRGTWMQPQHWPDYVVRLAGPANHLPRAVRERLVHLHVRNAGIDPSWAGRVTAAGLAQWVVDLYQHDAPPSEQYDVVMLGAPSGGAGHLAALLGAPFLSQHFVSRYHYRGDPDDIAAYQAFGGPLAETILANNPDLAVVNHYDPLHDRFLIPYVNYIRMKLLDVPGPYAEFITRRLRPGGTILFADCRYAWGQYRIARRHTFQVGGLGGVRDTVYVNGSPEVAHFLAGRRRSPTAPAGWSLPYPWLNMAESEWGTLAPFQAAVEQFAAAHGYRFRVLHGSHPEDFSRLAFYASYQAALQAGREPAGVLVECFTHTSPTAALAGGLLPLWLPFNCSDSLAFLKQMVPDFPHGKPVLLALVPSYSPSWDVCPASAWQAASGGDAIWIGVDPAAFPADLAGIFRFVPDLQRWRQQAPKSEAGVTTARPLFSVADLEALIGTIAAAGEAAGAAVPMQAESNVTERGSSDD